MSKNNTKSSGKPRARVLSDHQKVGRKFIPPMQQLGPWKDANWIGTIIPELLWIGLLNHYHGFTKGAALCLALAHASAQATGINPEEFKKKFGKAPKQLFSNTSAYKSLTAQQQQNVITYLKMEHQIESFIDALAPLAVFYPDCPINFLFEGRSVREREISLEDFSHVLSSFFDKYDKPAMFMMANAVYIAFCTNKLKIIVSDNRHSKEDSSLANFPAIQNYPDTDESRVVGAGIRATINRLVAGGDSSQEWPNYFWNRGLELETCDYQGIYETYE
jgi:hypothetical protein